MSQIMSHVSCQFTEDWTVGQSLGRRHREESRWSSLTPVYQRPAWNWSQRWHRHGYQSLHPQICYGPKSSLCCPVVKIIISVPSNSYFLWLFVWYCPQGSFPNTHRNPPPLDSSVQVEIFMIIYDFYDIIFIELLYETSDIKGVKN